MADAVKNNGIRHIAFIMDGNGRWAKARGLTRDFGHRAGVETFTRIVRYCGKLDIPVVTVYAFSTENWKRPKKEVELLMGMLYKYIEEKGDELAREGVRFRVIGDKSALGERLNSVIDRLEKKTENNTRLLNIALNYGGRDEIVYAVNRLISEGKTNITAQDISGALYTYDCPDPDLIVRTSGELRISNFLLWQCAYSEFYFTDTLWPDMTEKDVDAAVAEYGKRRRRYGGI